MGAERATREHRQQGRRAGERDTPTTDDRPVATLAASTRAGAGRRIQPRLEVGAVDDPYEREAEATADAVMRQLEPGTTAFTPPPPTGRVARAAEVGGDGGEISAELERTIAASTGAPLPGGVRAEMEGAFGTDFTGVRVHTDSPAAARIQARAFTHGGDVHFAPGQYQPDTPGGRHLLAHELTHVVQQSGGVHRLMWDQATFDKQTSQAWTTKSTAQKEIRTLLLDYHTRFPFGDLDETTAKSAFDAVTRMKLIADAYLAKNVKTVDGEEIERSSRADRIAGMRAFAQTCQGELDWLTQRINRGKDGTDQFDADAANLRVKDEAGVKKVTDHYAGDAQSCFRKLGSLIEMAAPAAGDSAGIALEVKIPVYTGVTVNLGFGAEVERGDSEDKYSKVAPPTGTTKPKALPVEVGLNVYAGVGGNVGPAAEVAGALGGYMRSRAQSGADAAELLSYALFRRGRSSPVIPREIVNAMWGEGNADAFGWQVAEAWSLGVEKRILDSMGQNAEGEEINENFVETGGFAKASAEVGISKVAKLEFEAEAFQGTRIDATSLTKRKGGAGMGNLKSGSAPTGARIKKQGARGETQKDVGRTTRGFRISAAAGNDMLSGGLEFGMRWISDGAHGKKTYKLSEATLGGEFAFTMPGDQIIGGGIGNVIPSLVEFVNRMIANARSRAAKEEGATPGTLGNVGHSLETAAMSMAQLATAKEQWAPPTQLAEDTGGFSSSTSYKIGIEFDLTGPELTITISQDKSSEVAKLVEGISKTSSGSAGVKFEMTKSTRLLEIKLSGGKPVLTWAGGTTG